MSFFVYGIDGKSGESVTRIVRDAATEADARRQVEQQGIRVTSVVRSHSPTAPSKPTLPADSAIVLPEMAPPVPTPREEMAAFDRTLNDITPRAYVTYALIGANVLVFVLMTLSGADFFKPRIADLLTWGAEYGPRVAGGQPWLLFTAMFVHIGMPHLVYNMIAFYYVGPMVERMLGNVGFLLLYIVAGLGGGLCSLYWNPVQVTAGASGAIFGVYAALFGLLLRQHRSIPEHVASRLKRFVLIFVGLNLIYSLLPGIDLAAHVGGMAVGFCAGLVLGHPLDAQGRIGQPLRNSALAFAGILLTAGGIAGIDLYYPNLDPLARLLERSYAVMHEFKVADRKADHDQLSNADFAVLIERDLLPEWRSAREGLARTSPIPNAMRGEVASIVNYMQARQDAWEALVQVKSESSAQQVREKQEIEKYASAATDEWHIVYVREQLQKTPSSSHGKNADLDRFKELFGRFDALGQRVHSRESGLTRAEFDGVVEKEVLPEWRGMRQAFAEFGPVPQDFKEDVAAILHFLTVRQEYWELRIASRQYDQRKEDARTKDHLANDAARAIRNSSGARLMPAS